MASPSSLPAIDESLLPTRALMDTGVTMRALGDYPTDPRSPVCRAFFEAMIRVGNDILIAAPTVAEVMRFDGKRQIPRTKSVEVVAFDMQCATLLGSACPMSELEKVKLANGSSLTHLKYDAMICACASRHNAECLISIDSDFKALGKRFTIDVVDPSVYLAPQMSIPLGPPLFPPTTRK